MMERVLEYVQRRRCPPNGFVGVYQSFDAASASVPGRQNAGYDNANTESWYRQKLDAVGFDNYPMLYWFEKACESSRTVVEIGGHVGVAYYPFSRLVARTNDMTWTIVDVPSVTREGEKLARERQRTNLKFVNSLDEVADAIDILMASGALQYIPGALLPERVRVMSKRPTHIIIHDTPVRLATGYITLQNLGTAWCPYRIHGYDELISPLLALGYELIDSWAKDRRVEIPSRPELRVDHYSGYYLRAKT